MVFKIGDEVKILTLFSSMDSGLCETMRQYEGMIATITDTSLNDYHINLDDGAYAWSDDVLELVEILKNPKGVPFILSKQKEGNDISYQIRTDRGTFEFTFVKGNKEWEVRTSGTVNRKVLLLLESIIRGLNS